MTSITGDMGKGPRATVRRDRLVDAPHLTWNAFVDLLSSVHYEELTPVQRVAYLAFCYDSEVKSGGHLRYFRNHGTDRLEETLAALGRLGAVGQQGVLERAGWAWGPESSEELDRLDHDYHGCHQDIPARLETWLEGHLDDFIVFEG